MSFDATQNTMHYQKAEREGKRLSNYQFLIHNATQQFHVRQPRVDVSLLITSQPSIFVEKKITKLKFSYRTTCFRVPSDKEFPNTNKQHQYIYWFPSILILYPVVLKISWKTSTPKWKKSIAFRSVHLFQILNKIQNKIPFDKERTSKWVTSFWRQIE